MRQIFRRMLLTLSAFFPLFAVLMGTFGNWQHKSYLVSLFAAVLLFAVLALCRKRLAFGEWLERQNPTYTCLMMSVFCLVLNGIWVLIFRPVQAPDYVTFFQTASDLANNRPLTGKDYVAMFPHILGYAAFLSTFLRLFGENLITAALVNVFLTVLSGIILYRLSLKYYGKKAAFLVFLLWTICPSKLLYNTMALSEPFYTFLLLLFFLLVSKAMDSHFERGQIAWASALGMLSGLVLAAVNAARPIGIIPMIAFFLWLIFLSDWEKIYNRKMEVLTFSFLLVLSYSLFCSAWQSYAAAQLGQQPPSVPGYNIYVGFNPETHGSYADEDMELLQSRYFGEFDRSAEATQQSMLESAKQRIADNIKGIPNLMAYKLKTLLGNDEGGAYYSKESLSDHSYSLWCIASNIWYYFTCVLAIAGCIQKGKKPVGDSTNIILLCMIGIIFAQLLAEVAARYHYCLIPMLLMMAAPELSLERKANS